MRKGSALTMPPATSISPYQVGDKPLQHRLELIRANGIKERCPVDTCRVLRP